MEIELYLVDELESLEEARAAFRQFMDRGW